MPKLKVTPLYGARGSDRAPLCSILRIDDDCNILLDCGWDDLFDPGLLENLKPIAPTVTAVLISHPDTLHLGALPYAVKRFGLKAPVYSTLPVHKMGQMFLYDQFLSRQATEDFECFSLDDVDEAFAKFHTLQYSQTANLAAKGKKIAVTPFNAGHLLGGTVWRINVDGEDIVYAVDINHRKDRHLNGATIEQVFDKPALMITSASNALISPVSKQVRDRDLLTSIMQTVRQDGNVLLPVDPAGRVLELICLLEEHWQRHQLGSYHLVFLTMVAYNTMEFAKSQLEWMNASFTTSFEHTRTNAFDTKYLRLCHTKADLQRLPRGPKVVLASLGSMQSGAAKELLVDYAMSPKNLIIFTERPVHGSLAHQLQTQASDNIRIQLSKRVPLEGLELAQHLESVERQRVQRAEGGGDGVDKGEVNGDGADAKVKVEDGLDALQFERGASGALTRLTAAKRTSSSLITVTEHGFEGVLMEGFVPMSDAAGPLFPYDEGEGEAAGDEYGELIDASRFDFSGGEAMAPLPTVAEAPPEQPMEVDTRPTKVVSFVTRLREMREMRCTLRVPSGRNQWRHTPACSHANIHLHARLHARPSFAFADPLPISSPFTALSCTLPPAPASIPPSSLPAIPRLPCMFATQTLAHNWNEFECARCHHGA